MIAPAPAAELRTEVRRLNIIELPDLLPGFIAYGSGDIDLEPNGGHECYSSRPIPGLELRGRNQVQAHNTRYGLANSWYSMT